MKFRSKTWHALSMIVGCALFAMAAGSCQIAYAPDPVAIPSADNASADKSSVAPVPPKKVVVQPLAGDDQIAKRLEQILIATGWFENPNVRVHDGVVFLKGTALNAEYKKWATNLVDNTQDVVAVVNKMEIGRPPTLDIMPIVDGVRDLWRATLQNLPFLGVGILIFLTILPISRLAQRIAERLLQRHATIPLIRELIARAAAIIVFLAGLYLVLRVSGTTQLALTVLGGTGLFGLVLGIAFREITENFLASIFLSVQRPFQIGDLVEIVGVTGYIHRLTIRTTVIVSLDGNYIQIPNATVYKNTIRNFTNNPKRRDDFAVFISYDKEISAVQDIILKVLTDHSLVLQQPEPWVLIDHLDTNTVELRVYFWIDCLKNNWLTVRSSVIRLTLHALKEANLLALSGPNAIVFPQGVPVHLRRESPSDQNGVGISGSHDDEDVMPQTSTDAEGQHENPRTQLKEQMRQARPLEIGPDLLSSHSKP